MNQAFVSSLKSAVLIIAALLGLLNLHSAHAFEGDLGGNYYDAPEARQYQRIQVGIVEDIREVVTTRQNETAGYIGGALGGLLGGVLGNTVGGGNGRMVAAALGGTLGAVAGKMTGDYAGREVKRSAEIIVTLRNGEGVSIVQEMDSETARLQPGDRVRLIEGQAVRVVKMRGNAM